MFWVGLIVGLVVALVVLTTAVINRRRDLKNYYHVLSSFHSIAAQWEFNNSHNEDEMQSEAGAALKDIAHRSSLFLEEHPEFDDDSWNEARGD